MMNRIFGFFLLTALLLGLTAQAAYAQNQGTILARDRRVTTQVASVNDQDFSSDMEVVSEPVAQAVDSDVRGTGFKKLGSFNELPYRRIPKAWPAEPTAQPDAGQVYRPDPNSRYKWETESGLREKGYREMTIRQFVAEELGPDYAAVEFVWGTMLSRRAGKVDFHNEVIDVDTTIWVKNHRPYFYADCVNPLPVLYVPRRKPPCIPGTPKMYRYEDANNIRTWYWKDNCGNETTTTAELPPTPRTPDPVTVTTTVTIPCPECPEIFYKAGATGREKATGGLVSGLLQTGVATAISVLTSSKGNRVRAGAISAGATFGSNRVANAKNPSHDKVDMKISWPDGHNQTIELKRNKSINLDRGGVAKWEDGLVTVKFGKQECVSFEPRTTVNWTVVPVVIRDGGKPQERLEPIKHQDDDNPVVAPDERRGDRRNNGGQQRAIAPTDGGEQVRNSSGSRWNRAMKPNN